MSEIENSIITRYRKEIWAKFNEAIIKYNLIEDNDHLMICISGGKDSFLLAKCIEELKKHGSFNFEVDYILMNPGYNEENLNLIKENINKLNLAVRIYNSDIFECVDNINDNPCFMCAKMRRGFLYNKATELNCNKIVLGHHYNDVIETTLLSMFYGAEIKTMLPHIKNDRGIDLIRPLYLVKEESIIKWANYNNLKFINCACKLTSSDNYEKISKRKEIKDLISYMKQFNPSVEQNIFNSLSNINLDYLPKK